MNNEPTDRRPVNRRRRRPPRGGERRPERPTERPAERAAPPPPETPRKEAEPTSPPPRRNERRRPPRGGDAPLPGGESPAVILPKAAPPEPAIEPLNPNIFIYTYTLRPKSLLDSYQPGSGRAERMQFENTTTT